MTHFEVFHNGHFIKNKSLISEEWLRSLESAWLVIKKAFERAKEKFVKTQVIKWANAYLAIRSEIPLNTYILYCTLQKDKNAGLWQFFSVKMLLTKYILRSTIFIWPEYKKEGMMKWNSSDTLVFILKVEEYFYIIQICIRQCRT